MAQIEYPNKPPDLGKQIIPMAGSIIGGIYGGPAGAAVGGAAGGLVANSGGDNNSMQRKMMAADPASRLQTLEAAKEQLKNTSEEYQKQVGPILDEAHKRALAEQPENQPGDIGGSN